LPSEVEVCAVKLPGRESRLNEPPFKELSTMVDTLSPFLIPFLDVPFAFFGHSMGGLISFELVRQLRRERQSTPVHLFVSGYRAPQLKDPYPHIHQLPDEAFLSELQTTYGTPEDLLNNPELIKLFLPLLRADFAVCETYVYADEDPLDCPVSVFGGVQDSKVAYEELAAWSAQTNSAFSLRMFPGSHFFLESARTQILQAVGQVLTRILAQID
jgi:medium-chain acyl-[acyl-carrier-protein] hydrolase